MADEWEIKIALDDAMKFLSDKGYEVVCVNLYGSQNYGLDTENSDMDFKAVVLPSIDDVINNTSPVSTSLEFRGGLIDVKDIRLMFENYKKQNTNYLETLFTPYWTWRYPYCTEWTELRKMANDIARADEVRALKSMYGMALQKQAALCHPYPSKVDLIEKYGYDAKQLSHIMRLHTMVMEYMQIPSISYANILTLKDDQLIKNLIRSVKTYERAFSVEEAQKWAKFYVDEIKEKVDLVVSEQELYPVLNRVYQKMDEIKARIIKKYFVRSLMSVNADI